MVTKKPKKAKPKKLNLPDDKPVKLNISFGDAIKMAATTSIKNIKNK